MAGQKRPQNVTQQSQAVTSRAVKQQADANSTTSIPVSSGTVTAPAYSVPTATTNVFDTLNQIRINSLGSTSIVSGIDKTSGFYDLNFKGISVTGDLVITETPTDILLGLKTPENSLTYIQSGTNLEQTGGRVYAGTDGASLQFRTIKVGDNLTLQQTANSIEIGLGFTPPTGDISNAINVGNTGFDIFHSKEDSILKFRKIESDNNILTLSTDVSGNKVIFTINQNQIDLSTLGGLLPVAKISGLHAIATNPDYNLLQNKPTIPTALSQLSDVSGTPTNGSILRYTSGTGWVPSADAQQNSISTIKAGPNTIVATVPGTDVTFAPGSELTVEANVITRTVSYNLKPTGITAGSYTNTSLTVDAYGRIIGIANGPSTGTSNFIDPTTQPGDMIVRGTNGTSRLAPGQADQVLTIVNGMPTWKTVGATASGTVRSVGLIGKNGINIEGGPITDSGIINVGLKPTGVVAGTYTSATITVDAFGRVTMASNNNGTGGGVVRSVNTGYGLTGGGPLTSDLTLSLQKTGVTAGQYTAPKITIDEYGRILQIQNGTAGGGGVTSVAGVGVNGINVVGGPITNTGTLTVSLTDTGVVAGEYGISQFAVNSQGRITNIDVETVELQGDIVSATTGEPVIDRTGGIYFPMFTSADIGSISHPVNTQSKNGGKVIMNVTTYQFMVATGETPDAMWAYPGGATGITPA